MSMDNTSFKMALALEGGNVEVINLDITLEGEVLESYSNVYNGKAVDLIHKIGSQWDW